MTCGCSSNWGINQTKWGCWDKCISIDPKSGSHLFVPTEGRASASLNRTKFMGLLSPWQSQAARFASDSPWFSPWFTPLHWRLPSFHCKAQEPHRKSGEWIPNCPGPFEMKGREALWTSVILSFNTSSLLVNPGSRVWCVALDLTELTLCQRVVKK